MNSPKVSTITSCYKAEKYLPLFLERLPQQTLFDSLQVVLDHSEPSEREIELVEAFSKQYPGKIKHIIREKVVPIYVAWNNCVQQADAEYLAVWNIDDLRTPDSLEQQYNALQRSDAGVVFGDFCIVDAFGKSEGSCASGADVIHEMHTRMFRAGPFFMFRRALCEKAGYFDEQLKSSADFDFCVRLAFHSQFLYVPVNLGYYLDAGIGASTRPDSVQPVEDVVIALRYGIYDRLDYTLLPRASVYVTPRLLQFGAWASVADYIPDWEKFLRERGQALLGNCMRNSVPNRGQSVFFQTARRIAKRVLSENAYAFLKKIWWKVRGR